MSNFVPLNPRPMLQSLIDDNVTVRLKWGQEYTGRLVSVDSYMNIQLNAAEENDNGTVTKLGQLLIRCNNVLWIKAADSATNGDTDMAE